MPTYHYPNLTIIEEQEINNHEKSLIGLSIIIRLPRQIDALPSYLFVQQAIQKHSNVIIPLDKFTRFEKDYVVVTKSPSETSAILANPNLRIGNTTVILLPCTIDYAAITLPIDTALPRNTQPVPTIAHSESKEPILIKVEGLPPHLCSKSIVERLFTNICPLTDIEFTASDSSFSAKTYALNSSIPSTAFVGIRAHTNTNTVLYLWPLWYNLSTKEMKPEARLMTLPVTDRPIRYTLIHGTTSSGNLNQSDTVLQATSSEQTGINTEATLPAKRAGPSDEPNDSSPKTAPTTSKLA